jgi:hypothetical protein
MRDLIFILLTLAFFGLMLAYVAGCAGLGRDPGSDGDRP